MNHQKVDVIIIGAGLTGLTLAYLLQKLEVTFTILEAKKHIGGRIKTIYRTNEAPVEMGATWLGKKHTALVDLLKTLDIGIFEQYLGTSAVYEPISTSPPQLVSLPPSSDPSYRIQGGSSTLIHTLKDSLPADSILTERMVSAIHLQEDIFHVHTSKEILQASLVVSTLPPRLLAQTIEISPKLPQELLDTANDTHTWMGESIKVALTYKSPFWRDRQDSGSIFSNVGPISEMYDHSNVEDSLYALKGFMNGAYYIASREQRLAAIMNQLGRYFGDEIKEYISYQESVWRIDPYIFHDYDGPLLPHNHNGAPVFRQSFLNGKFFIAGAETADAFPGYMDGAVRSAQYVFEQIKKEVV